MLKEALQYLFDEIPKRVTPYREKIDNIEYSDRLLHVIKPPRVETLKFQRLEAFAQYVKREGDSESFIQIASPAAVRYLADLDADYRDRECYAAATFERTPMLSAGTYYPPETMAIALQVEFAVTDDVIRLQRLVGNVAAEESIAAADDGISQTVAVKRGIALVGKQAIENPFVLAPYRTFAEVPQPASPFILRARPDANKAPSFALFECDNARWQIEAIASIKSWLQERLPGVDILG